MMADPAARKRWGDALLTGLGIALAGALSLVVAAGPGGVAAVLWQAGMRAPVAAILLGAAAPWLASRLWRRTAAS